MLWWNLVYWLVSFQNQFQTDLKPTSATDFWSEVVGKENKKDLGSNSKLLKNYNLKNQRGFLQRFDSIPAKTGLHFLVILKSQQGTVQLLLVLKVTIL